MQKHSPQKIEIPSCTREAIFRPSYLLQKVKNFAQNDKIDMFPARRNLKKKCGER